MVSPVRRLAAALALGAVLAVAIGFTSGHLSLVETHGNSMAPRITTGDLVVVHRSAYAVGDVVAYHSKDLEQVVLHRVIGIHGDRYRFQGDHNTFVDPEEPVAERLLGKELLHIPGGGVWLDRLTSPIALALLAFALLAGGGTAVRNRRSRRRRTVAQHAARSRRSTHSLSGLPSWATTTTGAAAVVGVLGTGLAALAWTTPTTSSATATSEAASSQAMTFSYSAEVPKSPAYDDTTVTDPEPIFRNLTDTVEVGYDYRGAPGTISVTLELSTTSGWHSTVPVSNPESFGEGGYSDTISLDLNGLEKRAQAAAEVTGISASQVDVAVVPLVITEDDTKFAPELALTLTPLQLSLPGGKESLTVGGKAPATETADPATPSLSILGRELPVSTGRMLSLAMLVGALLAAGVVALIVRLSAPATEAAAIRRRYGQMLVRIDPMPMPAGRPVIDVADFATLAKVAERYDLLVLHWARSDVETFVVQDQGTTYRYRTGTGVPRSSPDLLFDTV